MEAPALHRIFSSFFSYERNKRIRLTPGNSDLERKMEEGKRITLVTGGAGYVGSHVVLALHDLGLPVVVFDDLSTGSRERLPVDVPFIYGNLSNGALLRKTLCEHGISCVMHLAASTSVPESIVDPLKYYRNNTCESLRVIQTCAELGIPHFIFCSTAAVYGTPHDVPILETTRTSPINPYGYSKLMTECMLRDISEAHAMRYVILRPFNVAGADPHGRSGQSREAGTHLIDVACQVARGDRDQMEIFGSDYPTPDGTCIRDYVHVSDVAEAHLLALRYLEDSRESEIFNLGNQNGFSVKEVIDAISVSLGHDFSFSFGPRRAGDPACLIANSEKARKLLGWKPKRADLTTQIDDVMRWYKKALSISCELRP